MSSIVAKGSTFRLEVPVELGEAGAATRQKVQRPVIGLQGGQPAPRVLVVDDERNNRDWLNRLLTSLGFEVREAENGEMALALWEAWKPHLVLMDMRMPVMDGLEAMRRIKGNPEGEKTVIIALTASVMGEDRRAALDAGADDYLAKPCREHELLAMIQTHLGLAYVHAGEDPVTEKREPLLKPERLTEELAGALREAIRDGDKYRLDELIREVGVRDQESASALRELADKYEYDALAGLLEEVCG